MEGLTINLLSEELKKVVSRANAGDSVTLDLDSDNNQLNLTFKGATKRTFTLGLREVQNKETKKINLEYKAHIKIIPGALSDIVKDALLFSDNIKFTATGDQFKTVAIGSGSMGKTESVFKKNSEPILEYNVEDESTASYALNYLSEIVKISGAADSALLEFSTKVPLTVEFSLTSGGTIKYILAPRRE